MGLDEPGSGRRGRRHHRRAWPGVGGAVAGLYRGTGDGRGGLDRGAEARLCAGRQPAGAERGLGRGLLSVELRGLGASGFDLDLLGFSDIDALLARKAGRTDPDEVPEVPAVPVSVLGDVWLLGRHRLVCGDSTDPSAVDAALAGVQPHLMVTDPPYGVEYDPAWRERAGVNDRPGRDRQGAERRPGGLARGLGAVSRRRRLCLAWRAARSVRWPRAWRRRASRSAARSSGPSSSSCSAGAIITGSMSPAGTRCARRTRATGPATASRPRSGRSRA